MGRRVVRIALLLAMALAAAAPAAIGALPAPPAAPAGGPAAGTGSRPVVFDGTPLFYIHDAAIAGSPAERAALISKRIETLSEESLRGPLPVGVREDDGVTTVVGGESVLMTVTDRDAAAAGIGKRQLAEEYARRIREAVAGHVERYSTRGILYGGLEALAALLLLVGLLLAFRFLFPKVYARIDAARGTRIRALRIGSFEILDAARMCVVLKGVVRWTRILLTVLLFYFFIPLVLRFLPWTRRAADRVLDYVVAPFVELGRLAVGYIDNFFFVAVIVLVTRYVIKIARLFFEGIEKGHVSLPGFYPDWAMPTFKIVRLLLIAFAAVVAFPYLPGAESPAFKGVSIFLGVLFSLGSTSAVANIVAGVILTYMRAFQLGDRVKIGDTVGDVDGKTLLVTRLRTIKNVDVTIPNATVLAGHITNYSFLAKEKGLILHTSVTIGYDAPWRTVHALLIDAARRTERILAEPAPFVLQTALNDFYVTYEINAYTAEPLKMVETYSDLHRNIQDAFNEGGVEIMSPHYAQLRDGNRTTIPASYLPGTYVPGAIRVRPVAGEGASAGPGKEKEGDSPQGG